jgi:hypothetical protein
MPKAMKPMFGYAFRSVEEREAYIARTIKGHDEQQAYKAVRRAESARGDFSLADPGAIFAYSWGYEQTNVEYFQVVARSGRVVTLRKIQSESVGYTESALSSMSDYVRPIKDAFLAPPCETCGRSEMAVWHDYTLGSYEHRFVAAPPPIVRKRLQFHEFTSFISFEHGIGSLVEIEAGGSEKPVYKSQYRSWYA